MRKMSVVFLPQLRFEVDSDPGSPKKIALSKPVPLNVLPHLFWNKHCRLPWFVIK